MLSPVNSLHSATKTSHWCCNSPWNMNKTLTAAVAIWKSSIAHWIKPICMVKHHTCWCLAQTFADQAPKKFMSSSATRERIIWSTRKSDAKMMSSLISTHWLCNQTTHTKFWSTTKRLNQAIWKTIGISCHQRKSRIQKPRNRKIGTNA